MMNLATQRGQTWTNAFDVIATQRGQTWTNAFDVIPNDN
jgi:hypothetical protein